eukprot:3705120-Prymnesium_polylepis.1
MGTGGGASSSVLIEGTSEPEAVATGRDVEAVRMTRGAPERRRQRGGGRDYEWRPGRSGGVGERPRSDEEEMEWEAMAFGDG